MKRLFLAFVEDESAATAVEYGLLIGGVSLAILAIVNGLGSSMNDKFTSLNTSLQ